MVVLHIGRIAQKSTRARTPYTSEQLLRQADIWFKRVIESRETMPRNLPPSEKYVQAKGAKDGTYTLWGWDRQCDVAYVSAIWETGINYKVLILQSPLFPLCFLDMRLY
jgi:hypothetical protein